jgi:hypothetical protein
VSSLPSQALKLPSVRASVPRKSQIELTFDATGLYAAYAFATLRTAFVTVECQLDGGIGRFRRRQLRGEQGSRSRGDEVATGEALVRFQGSALCERLARC